MQVHSMIKMSSLGWESLRAASCAGSVTSVVTVHLTWQGRAGRGTLGISCFQFQYSSVLLVSPGNVCSGCDGCSLAEGDTSGRRSEGRRREASVCRVSRAELGSAAQNQSPPLSHCVYGSPRASLSGSSSSRHPLAPSFGCLMVTVSPAVPA